MCEKRWSTSRKLTHISDKQSLTTCNRKRQCAQLTDVQQRDQKCTCRGVFLTGTVHNDDVNKRVKWEQNYGRVIRSQTQSRQIQKSPKNLFSDTYLTAISIASEIWGCLICNWSRDFHIISVSIRCVESTRYLYKKCPGWTQGETEPRKQHPLTRG